MNAFAWIRSFTIVFCDFLADFTTLKGANFKRGTYSLTGLSGFITMVSDKTKNLCGGDWCLVVPLVFKASVGLIRSRVGSIPIRLRHLFPGRKTGLFPCSRMI